ncbi:MAG: CHASE3 domain-containing protein, partial [Nitrospirales bacterium]|nr:CHASE3 domain-containing protein [Nitrospirales bacterium]
VTYKSVQTFSHDEDRLNHVYHVQSAAAEYMRLVVDLETGFRGFVLTKQDQFLQPYQAAKTRVLTLGQSLQQMVKEEEALRIHVEQVQKLVQKLIDEKDDLIEEVKDGDEDEAIDYIKKGQGRRVMLTIREEMDRFDRREVELLRQALASSSKDRSYLMGVVIGGGGLALFLMIIPIQLIARSITGPLTALVKTVGNISGGRIPEVPVLDRSDEIGDLTRVMQAMTIQIREHIQRIEQSENELRALYKNLAASEAKYRGIVDHAPIGIFTMQGVHMIFSNRQNWILAGRDPDDSLDPEGMWETIHPADRDDVRRGFSTSVSQGVPFEKVYRFLHENGSVRKVLSRAIPIKNEKGEMVVYQGFNVDITALEQMRIQLSRAERLATLGQVAAGIAHEIRNPLVGIGSTTSLLLEEMQYDDAKVTDLNTILRETKRLDKIVNQIVEYAKPREIILVSFSICEMVRETLALLSEPLHTKHIRIEFTPTDGHPLLQADRDQVKQVLLNAIQNAIEASPSEG